MYCIQQSEGPCLEGGTAMMPLILGLRGHVVGGRGIFL